MSYSVGAAGTLFHANFKINTEERGFNLKFHIVGADYVTAVPKALALAPFILNIMPNDARIFYATVTNDNSKRDSRFLRGALGLGKAITASGPPVVPALYDMPDTCLLVRFENTEGDEVTRKLNPIPDGVLTDALLQGAVADVLGVPGTPPVAGVAGPTTWYTDFNLLMQAIVYYTSFVKSGHAPGGAFSYAPWLNGYYLRPGRKKGGRVFNS